MFLFFLPFLFGQLYLLPRSTLLILLQRIADVVSHSFTLPANEDPWIQRLSHYSTYSEIPAQLTD